MKGAIIVRRFFAFIFILVALTSVSIAEESHDIKLTELNKDELNALISDVDSEIKLHHEAKTDAQEEVLKVTEAAVETYFAKQDIEISWAWVDYTYERDWDYYTLTTHIDYRDANGIKQKPGVYSEVFAEDGSYDVYYLLIGTEAVIDRRTELPDELWSQQPVGIINTATALDLSTFNREELKSLRKAAQDELSRNHTPDSTITNLLLSLTQMKVEQYFTEKDIDISWAWFDYTYTCDWDLYTLLTPISYKDADGKYQEADVYAEAYPIADQYSLCYLTVNDSVLIDKREQLPKELYAVSEEASEINITSEATETSHEPQMEAVSEKTEATDSASISEAESAFKSMPTPEPIATLEPAIIERGSKGEDVQSIQQQLIVLGFLDDEADGDLAARQKRQSESFKKHILLQLQDVLLVWMQLPCRTL